MEFIDIFDKDRLKFLIDNFDYFSDKIGSFKDASNGYKEITNKKTIFTILNNLFLSKSTIYNHSKKDSSKKGRLFGSNSLQTINKIIRHTLCKDLCLDIDIVNAHNVFLQHYCIENNIDFKWLRFYNENRDELLIELMSIFSIDRDTAKKICLEIINGGGQKWFKQIEIPPPNWLSEFLKEIKNIHKKIAKLETGRFIKSKNDNPTNPYGTCLNTILCEMENHVLSFMIEYCNLKNIKISTLCFDGILIEKHNLDILEMNSFVSNHSGIDVKLIIKDMDESISLDIETNFKKSDEMYVNPEIFNCSEKVVIVKAGLGTGKTTATISYINANKDTFKKIIFVTPRITYAKSIYERLNKETIYNDWVIYNAKNIGYIIDKDRVVVQCESLYRCANLFQEDTLIVIDEVESFLTSLTSKKTHRHHEETLELFEFLMYSKKIICLDAFISDKTLNIFKSLELPFSYVHYTRKLKQRQYIQIKKEDKEDLFQKWADYIINEINNGKKMYLFISSKNKLLGLVDQLRIKLPHINLLYYTSDHKQSIDNVNELWTLVDVILTTSTLTVGVNYDVKNHFHSLGAYLSSNSKNLVRDAFQSMYRIRHLIDNILIFALNTSHYGMNYLTHPTSSDEVLKRINEESLLYIRTYEAIHKTKHRGDDRFIWLKNLIVDNILEMNCSIIDIENVFMQYLNECNYVECDIMNDIDSIFIMTDDELKSTIYEYHLIPSISFNEMKEIRKRDFKSEIDNLKIEKFYFQQSVMDSTSDSDESILWGLYCDYGRNKFRNLRYEKGIIKETLNISEVVDNSLPLIAEKMGIQLIHILKISSWFNLNHSQDVYKIIPNDVLKKLIPLFKENIKDIYTAFNLRETRSKSNLKDEWTIRKITTITNAVLDRWGYTKITKRSIKRERNNEKRTDISDYQLENTENTNVFENLKMKS